MIDMILRFSSLAERKSVPNGFSMMTRRQLPPHSSSNFAVPRSPITGVNTEGGVAR
jgi:hypothetical protein